MISTTHSINISTEDPYPKVCLVHRDHIGLHPFYRCTLDQLDNKEHKMRVHLEYKNSVLYLSSANDDSKDSVLLEHSVTCPIRLLDEHIHKDLFAQEEKYFVRLGVGVLIEDTEGRALVTKRSRHLRTFPSTWVIPGGHVDPGETLTQAAVREIREETGLMIAEDQLILQYESVFPVLLHEGVPTRHHIVVYYRCKLSSQSKASFLPDEVEAAAWLDKPTVIEALKQEPSTEVYTALVLQGSPPDATAMLLPVEQRKSQHQWSEEKLPIRQLQSILVNGTLPPERLSTATRYVLREWLRKQ